MRTLRSSPARLAPALLLFLLVTLTTSAASPPIRLPRTGRVSGHIRDQNGTALANAQVFIVGTALNALSDSTGAYHLPAVPEGTQQIRAAFIGYKSSQATITIHGGKTTIHDFQLEATAVHLEELTLSRKAAEGDVPQSATVPRDAKEQRIQIRGGAAPTPAVNGLAAEPWRRQREPGNTEAYARIEDNRFLPAISNPVSTFSIDVDAASYSNVRDSSARAPCRRRTRSAWKRW